MGSGNETKRGGGIHVAFPRTARLRKGAGTMCNCLAVRDVISAGFLSEAGCKYWLDS